MLDEVEEDDVVWDGPVHITTPVWFDGANNESYNRAIAWASLIYQDGAGQAAGA